MRALPLLVVLLCAGGCRKKLAEPEGPGIDLGGPAAQANNRPEVVGPVRWWDSTGLCLEVPAGWAGHGRGSGGRLLTLEQEETGVRFEILLDEARRERPDLVRVFADSGSYRSIPALGPAGVGSWVSDVPGGPTLQEWTASVRNTPVRFEAHYPFGRGFVGMADVEGLLRAICVE